MLHCVHTYVCLLEIAGKMHRTDSSAFMVFLYTHTVIHHALPFGLLILTVMIWKGRDCYVTLSFCFQCHQFQAKWLNLEGSLLVDVSWNVIAFVSSVSGAVWFIVVSTQAYSVLELTQYFPDLFWILLNTFPMVHGSIWDHMLMSTYANQMTGMSDTHIKCISFGAQLTHCT